MRRPRTLRSRLFSWFFGAILLAIGTSALVVGTTRPEGTSAAEAAARHIALRLAAVWDDPSATRQFLDEVRDVTGFEVRLVAETDRGLFHVRRVVERGGWLTPAGADRVLVPVLRGHELLGALEMNRFGARPAPRAWWRLGLAMFATVGLLSAMASRVANLLARPLEQLAFAADRLGSGDLAHRADVASAPGWVALEVRDVAVSYNRMADRVEAMVRGQRELLGAISHELRSPLARALVALEIVRERTPRVGDSPPPSAAALDDVENELGAVDGILKELLDVTRAGLSDLRRENRPLVEWIRARAAEEPTPPAVVVEASPAAAAAVVPFDAALLARVIHNLLVNARAHGHPADLPIVVGVTLEGSRVRVVVRDRGPGFPEGFADRAFEPFVRGNVARSRPSAGAGYGLGLAIVQRVVQAHGGRAFARNSPPQGAGAAVEAGAPGGEVGFDLPLVPRDR